MSSERARELCRLAGVLADDVDGLPRWVARNRAVSTAYYALFHALAEFCARELVGAWTPYPAFRHVYRSLDRGAARHALASFDAELPSSQALRRFGTFFADLQDKRHRADYDPSYRIARAELLALIADTVRQVETLDGLERQERRLFAARLIGRTRNPSGKSRS